MGHTVTNTVSPMLMEIHIPLVFSDLLKVHTACGHLHRMNLTGASHELAWKNELIGN
jgi:hypothetical protein